MEFSVSFDEFFGEVVEGFCWCLNRWRNGMPEDQSEELLSKGSCRVSLVESEYRIFSHCHFRETPCRGTILALLLCFFSGRRRPRQSAGSFNLSSKFQRIQAHSKISCTPQTDGDWNYPPRTIQIQLHHLSWNLLRTRVSKWWPPPRPPLSFLIMRVCVFVGAGSGLAIYPMMLAIAVIWLFSTTIDRRHRRPFQLIEYMKPPITRCHQVYFIFFLFPFPTIFFPSNQGRRFNWVLSIEVAEHIPPEFCSAYK